METQRTMPDPEQTPTVTVTEAARILGISRNTAYRAVEAGTLPALRYGHKLLVPTARLRALVGLDPSNGD
jgi:excisionase family DNA binding protein